jgi:hypothetical protein
VGGLFQNLWGMAPSAFSSCLEGDPNTVGLSRQYPSGIGSLSGSVVDLVSGQSRLGSPGGYWPERRGLLDVSVEV